ncbi:unnamed protein product [Tuber melanosporum]|uniref:(Perigord truffle) hypothetical protein n=1 Tax=Tuber melanosporum (strain Mel28) TaxID=656061 RepID=D5GQ24_TUBMM|nr:uncharacterized protein GSTUM_00012163001 [Tuber melanosporum]CAZ86617.1 unnamed protein product [Tuber melanosporum]
MKFTAWLLLFPFFKVLIKRSIGPSSEVHLQPPSMYLSPICILHPETGVSSNLYCTFVFPSPSYSSYKAVSFAARC